MSQLPTCYVFFSAGPFLKCTTQYCVHLFVGLFMSLHWQLKRPIICGAIVLYSTTQVYTLLETACLNAVLS